MERIVIAYRPRPQWTGAGGIHARLDAHRFSVIIAHRRFGKTLGVVNQVIKRAIGCPRPDGRFGYIAPYRAQAKAIAWSYVKRYSAAIPGREVSETELSVTLPNGAKIRLFGADNPDSLRGLYFDGLVMDEMADIRPEAWGEVLRPALSDREGWCIFIGTPRGQNALFERYNEALTTPGWYAGLFRADETGVLPEEELAALRAEMGEARYRQEFLCDFQAAADDVLISPETVFLARQRRLGEGETAFSPLVMGLDVARFGDDESVLTLRRGFFCYPQRRYRHKDTMQLAALVAKEAREYAPEAVFVDAGAMGAGVVDRLRQLGVRVMEVNFGGGAADTRYRNKRAEMWGLMAEWLRLGAIPDDARLAQELSLPRYFFDAAGRVQIEPKEKLKARLGFSPDGADSLALTFAMPVVKRKGQSAATLEYDPLLNM